MNLDHPMIDYLAIGHLARDITDQGSMLGGTVAYAGRTALALGCSVGIVTSCSSDLNLSPLEGIHIFNLPSEESTTFNNIYHAGKRSQRISSTALKLGPASIPLQWRQTSIIHLAPIANEVTPEIIHQFDSSFIGLTLQGWLRGWDDEGWVHLNSWETTMGLLSSANAVVLSIEDLQGDEDAGREMAKHCAVLAVTRGSKGVTIFYGGDTDDVPAPVVQEIEATGAGDIFAAPFFKRLQEGADPREAAEFANQIAAASVTKIGLSSTPTHAEIRPAGANRKG